MIHGQRTFVLFLLEHLAGLHILLQKLVVEEGVRGQLKLVKELLVEHHYTLGESGLYSLLEGINDVDLLGRGHEDKGYLGVLEHIQYSVKHHLLGGLDVVVDVLKYKQQTHIVLVLEVLLNIFNHLNCVIFCDTLKLQGLAELHEDLAFRIIKYRVDSDHLEELVILLLLDTQVLDVLFYLVEETVNGLLVPTE